MDTLSFTGHFWLPGRSEAPVAGMFDFSSAAGGELRLIGTFTSFDDLAQGTVRDTKRIIGADLRGKPYTLDNCQQATLGTGQTFRVSTVIEGYALEAGQAVECDGLKTSLTNLQSWLGISGVASEITVNEDHKVEQFSVHVRQVDELIAQFSAGDVAVVHAYSMTDGFTVGGSVSETFRAKLSFNGILPLADAVDYASDLQDLVTIATNRVAAFEDIELTHPDFVRERTATEQMSAPARLWSHWLAQPEPGQRQLAGDDLTFTFKEVGDINGVSQWMAAAEKYRSQLGRVMNTRYNRQMFPQDVHLGRTAALESFHKHWSGKKRSTLNPRLHELTDLAGDPFDALIPKPKQAAWRKRVVAERNNTAHHLGNALHQDIAELYYLSESAYWVFVLCMMREAQLPQACYDHLVGNRDFQRCARQLQAII